MGFETTVTSNNGDRHQSYMDDTQSWMVYADEHRPLLHYTVSNHGTVNNYETKEDCHEHNDPPYRWVILFACFLAGLQYNGFCTCWGVFQDYYLREEFGKSNNVVMQLSLIGAMLAFLQCVLIIPSEVIIQWLQMKGALMVVTLLIFLGLTFAAFSTEIWQLYLSLALCTATGLGIYYTACMKVIPQWFTRNSGFAFGILTSSCAASGLVFPPLVTWSTESLGIRWTFIILSLILTVVNIINCALIRERPVAQEDIKDSKLCVHWDLLKDPNFVLWVVIAMLRGPVDMIPGIFLPSYATYIGLSPMEGATILSAGAVMGTFGAISSGMVADWIGNVNALILYALLNIPVLLFVWMHAVTFNSLLLFMVLFAFLGNAFYVLVSPISHDVAKPTQKVFAFAVAIGGCGIGMLVGPIIPSAIEAATSVEPYMPHRWMCVTVVTFATLLSLILKLRLRSRFFEKV